MKKLRIYLDTSVINFLFAEDSPDFKKVTKDFFNSYLLKNKYQAYISNVVEKEINATKNSEIRNNLLSVIDKFPIEYVKIQDTFEIEDLSFKYIEHGILPQKMLVDATHIAIAVVNKIDVLLSWNFKHLANVYKERKVIELNHVLGYTNEFRILTPMEVIDYENL